MGDQVERFGAVQMRSTVVGPLETNAYLLTDRWASRQVLIDPGDEPDKLLELVYSTSRRATLDLIIVTHRHPDHLRALAAVARETRARVAAGMDDADAVTDETGVRVDRALTNGDQVQIAGIVLEVVALRGHTPGSIALALTEPVRRGPNVVHLFSGDALLAGGLGPTGANVDRFSELYTDVVVRVFARFGDNTTVRPGHGPATTLGEERPHLREWRSRGW